MPASRTLLAAAAIGVASLAFAGGVAVSSDTAAPARAPPIVNVDVWSETASEPAQAIFVQMASTTPSPEPTLQCDPWAVSDAAMEEILREMQRRGWRQPGQGDAVESMASLGVQGIGAVDPDAPIPSANSGRPMITVLTDEEAERLRTEQISSDQLIVDEATYLPPS
jgi:hypothetical protein